jgi:hypothetical protein
LSCLEHGGRGRVACCRHLRLLLSSPVGCVVLCCRRRRRPRDMEMIVVAGQLVD